MLWFGLVCTTHFIDLYHWVSHGPTISMVISCSNSRDWLVCPGLVLYAPVHFIDLCNCVSHGPTITMVLSCSNSRDWLVCSGLVLYVRLISLTYIIESVMVRLLLWLNHVLIHVIDWYALVWSSLYGSLVSHGPTYTITMVLSCSNSRDWLVCSGLVL